MTVGGAVRTGRYRHSALGSYTMVIQTKQLHLINRYRYTALITRLPAHGQALFTTREKVKLDKGPFDWSLEFLHSSPIKI